MKNFILKWKSPLIAVMLSTLLVSNAFAAELFIVADESQFDVDDEFTVSVILHTEGQDINSVDGKLVYPDSLLEVSAINTEGSIVNFWFQEPAMAKVKIGSGSGDEIALLSHNEDDSFAEISFSGLMLGGFTEESGELFKVDFVAKHEGKAAVALNNIKVLVNDGAGTAAEVKLNDYNFQIGEEQVEEPVEMTYEEEKEAVVEEGIVTKDLDMTASKCEFVVMNGRAAGWEVDEGKTVSAYFKDINTAKVEWCVPYADYAYENGIVQGRAEGVFGVKGAITRYEVAVILARQLTDEEELDAEAETDFSDDADIVSWARGAVVYLKENEIFKGFTLEDGGMKFGGDQNIVKVDAAIVLYRTFFNEE